MLVREAVAADLEQMLILYTNLHHNPLPQVDSKIAGLWQEIIEDPRHHLLIGEEEEIGRAHV